MSRSMPEAYLSLCIVPGLLVGLLGRVNAGVILHKRNTYIKYSP
jgi:hypothetical protein